MADSQANNFNKIFFSKSSRPIHFTVEQSREQVINSILNSSKSKSSWTFSKQKRFQESKQKLNIIEINKTVSLLNKPIEEKRSFVPKNHSYGFGKSKRKVFTEVPDSPCCWIYNPEEPKIKWKKSSLFQGRDKCKNGSYLNKEKLQIPGPSDYCIKSLQKSKGFTLRQKTTHERTYFIQNREAQQVPGPGQYSNQKFENISRKSFTSKFRDNCLGTTGIRSKSKRFITDPEKRCILSTSLYQKIKTPWDKGCSIGSQKRYSFIDNLVKNVEIPGPGDYELPSQFGHYKKM